MPQFLVIALGFYVLSTSVGLLLRTFLVRPFSGITFSHAMHAHSHTLYFGWAALGIFALVFRRFGSNEGEGRKILWSIAALSLATFVSFLQGGYSTSSIVLSSLSLPLWLVAGVASLRLLRGEKTLAASYLRVGMVYLFLSIVSALARVVVLAAKVADPLWGRLAVFGFLFCFAWFLVFSLFGLLLSRGGALGARFDEGLLRWHLRFTAPLAWLTFPLGVAGGAEGPLGLVAKIAAILLFVPGVLASLAIWRAPEGSSPWGGWLRWIACWVGLTALLEALGGLGMAEIAVASRHLAVLYLHVLLVGVVTSSLFLLHFVEVKLSRQGTLLHHLGLVTMTLGLGLAGLPALVQVPGWLPRAGMVIALLGGAVSYSAGALFITRTTWTLLRRRSEPTSRQMIQESGS